MTTQPTEMRQNNPRLTLNYGVFLVVAIIVVGLYLLALPVRLAELQTVCPHATLGQCGLQPTAERASRLQASGLSLEFYGAYYVGTRFIATLFWWAVGLLILFRRPSERIALLTAYLLLLYPTNNAGTLSSLPNAYPWLELPVRVIGTAGWLCWIVFFFVFPNGRWVPRWRYIGWYIVFASVLFISGSLFLEFAASPAGQVIATIFFPLTFLLCLGAQIYRYRKVAQLGERQQTKWIVYGISMYLGGSIIIGLFATLFAPELIPAPVNSPTQLYMDLLLNVVGYLTLPITIGICILRYRLYDIDLVIRRTLQYSLLSGLLGLTYFGLVIVLQNLLSVVNSQPSELVTVLSTLAIAALFFPLRNRVQEFIDKRFYRKKYDAQKVLAEFAATCRDETDLDKLVARLAEVIDETLQPEKVSVWIKDDAKPKRDRADY